MLALKAKISYAYTYDQTHSSGQLHELYEGKLEGGEEDESADVAVAGRIMAKRVFGKLAFFTLQDETSTIQLHLEKNRLGDSFKVRTIHMRSQKHLVYDFGCIMRYNCCVFFRPIYCFYYLLYAITHSFLFLHSNA